MTILDQTGIDLGEIDRRDAGIIKDAFDAVTAGLIQQQAQKRRRIDTNAGAGIYSASSRANSRRRSAMNSSTTFLGLLPPYSLSMKA